MLNINKNNRLITAPFQKQVINDPDEQIIEHLQTEDTEINYNNFQFQRLETIQNLKFDRVRLIYCENVELILFFFIVYNYL